MAAAGPGSPSPTARPGQWYLHIFDVTQPDLNWKHPQVVAEFHDILRFWCERGVDGFRVDVAHGLVKREGLPDWHGKVGLYDEVDADTGPTGEGRDAEQLRSSDGEVLDHTATGAAPMWDQDGVHEIYRGWRRVLEAYGAPGPHPVRRGVGRPGAPPRALRAPRRDAPGVQLRLPRRPLGRHRAEHGHRGLAALQRRRRCPHDVGAVEPRRRAARLPAGLDQSRPRPNGIRADDPQPDAALGLRRARAATALMLALPGGAYVYQGEELGLPEHTTMPDSFRQDPTFHRTARHGHRPRRLPGADAVGQGARRATDSAPVTPRGCRSPTSTATSPSTSRRASRARPSSCTAPCSSTAAGTASGTAAWPGTHCRPTPSSPCATPPATGSAPCSW